MHWGDLIKKEDSQDIEIKKGKYKAVIKRVNLFEEKEPPLMVVEYQIMDGPQSGTLIPSFKKLNENSMEFMAKDLSQGEAEPPPKNETQDLELSDFCYGYQSIIEKPLEIFVSPKKYDNKTFYNVYINSVLEQTTFGVDNNDDLPF